MKIVIVPFLILFSLTLFGQEKTDVRKTFGVSMSVFPQNESRDFYQKKIGFIHRRCFKGFVLQSEFNWLKQDEPIPLLSGTKNATFSYTDYQMQETHRYNSSQRFFNSQWTVSKGWTNDKINLYAGAGFSISQSEMTFSYSKSQVTPQLDSLGNPFLLNERVVTSTSETAKYIHAGVVVKASAEFKLVDKVTMLVQFSPEISRGWRYKTETPEWSKKNYTVMTSSLLEVGVHYRL